MPSRPHRAPRVARGPFHVGMLARQKLGRLARRDAASGAPASRPADTASADRDQGAGSTPTVQAMQAHANAYARREEARFFSTMHGELAEYRILVTSLEGDAAFFEERSERIAAADRTTIGDGSGPVFEELRRAERRLKRGRRRADELSALLHARFTAAKLRAGRYYDFSDERLAIYWGALRRADGAGPEVRAAVAPTLRRPEWLTVQENTKMLEIWQGRTDVQA